MSNIWYGSWQDHSRSALDAALDEVGLHVSDFILVEHSDEMYIRLESVNPDGRGIDAHISWNESRQQYRAVLRRDRR